AIRPNGAMCSTPCWMPPRQCGPGSPRAPTSMSAAACMAWPRASTRRWRASSAPTAWPPCAATTATGATCTERRAARPRLLQLDLRLGGHAAPAVPLGLDLRAELIRAVAQRERAGFRQLGGRGRVAHRLGERLGQLVAHLGGHAGRAHHAVPGGHVVVL